MKTKLHYVFSVVLLLVCFSVSAQNNGWKQKTNKTTLEGTAKFHLESDKVQYFELNTTLFKQSLTGAPLRGQSSSSNVSVSVPGAGGVLESFVIYEAPVFSESLSARYPNIKSYVGFSLDNLGARMRMSVSPQGVQTMITYIDKEAVFVMPSSHGSNNYLLYNKSSRGNYVDEFECSTVEALTKEYDSTMLRDADDQTLRTYRLAVSVNGEYTIYHGGTIAGALAAINATVTRVNEVFETDMAITFSLVDADELIFTNPATDPYTSMGAWNAQLQNELNTTIGNGAYDIGHMFGASGGGGNAGCIGCVCEDGSKGSGITSPADAIPEGDNFDIDYVAHEIGHQMGANHTFAFSTEGTGVNSEPGSGTTIMGYAGITGSNNVQQHSDPYFHYHSINQVLNNVASAPNNCATTTNISNNPPSADAGSDYSIPKGTAYVLRGSATDADGGDSLTYCWEQTDSGAVTNSTFGPTLTSGSMNRSLPPSTSSDRYIPNFSRVLNNQLTQTNPTINTAWETVSNVGRNLNWALTVRDREPTATGLGGQSSFDLMIVSVQDVTPFTVSTPPTWGQNATQTVNWVVGQTNVAPINCQTVNVLFAANGVDFDTTLASGVPNTGSASITVPNIANTNNAKILVEAADNIFYAVSNAFAINGNSDFVINNNSGDQSACNIDSVMYEFNLITSNGFSETTTFSATGAPAGANVSFTPTELNGDGTFTMLVDNLLATANGDYTITVTGTATSFSRSTTVNLSITDGHCDSAATNTDNDRITRVIFNTINNVTLAPSADDPYQDFTAISTDIERGSSHDITVHVNTNGNYFYVNKVWIDWNQNCSFSDAGEEYDLGTANNVVDAATSNSPLTIEVPTDAVLGTTRMRVGMKNTDNVDNSFGPCESGFWGQIEDYSVNVLASIGIGEFTLDNLSIFPNPNQGEFTINFNSKSNENIMVQVFDIRGRSIYNKDFQNTGEFNQVINLNSAQAGVYLLKIQDGSRTVTKKIIVE